MMTFKPGKAELRWSLTFEGAWPTSVAFLGSSSKLAAGNRAGQILLWDLPEKTSEEPVWPVRQLVGHDNGITHLLSADEGRTLISSSMDHSVRVWDITAGPTGSAEVVLDRETREREAKRKRDKKLLDAPGVKVATQESAHVFNGHQDWVQALGLSGDGRRLISGDDQGKVVVHDLPSRKMISEWKVEQWAVAADLSPDGKTALVSEYRRKGGDFNRYPPALKLWNVESGKELRDLGIQSKDRRARQGFYKSGLITGCFSPDGKLVALGQGGETDTGKVLLIEAETGKLLHSVGGHRYGVTDVTFTADGKHVLSCGRDTMVRVCRVEDGKEVATLGKSRGGQFKDWLHALALSPDQKRVAAADIAGKVQVWEMV